jgi:hypothetical protein
MGTEGVGLVLLERAQHVAAEVGMRDGVLRH